MEMAMIMSRRKAVGLVGGGVVLAATAAGTGFAVTRTPHRALEAWGAAGEGGDPRRKALSYAILAPNPHNRQPWIADLREPGLIVLDRDRERVLPQTDPLGRQITIGMGCFVELLSMALAEAGLAADIALFPEGDAGPVAVARLRQGGVADPLFAHVLARRSCKEPFEARAVPREAVEALAPFATIIDDPERVARLRMLTWDAWKVEADTPRTMQESIDLMRFGRSEIEANPDGIDLGGAFLEGLMLLGLLSRERQSDPSSFAAREAARIYSEMLHATPAYAVLTSAANTPADHIEAGRKWLRLNLATTGLGLSLHPVSQALQEFPEMAPLRGQAHELLAQPGHTVQMLGRLGFGPDVPPSPRWPVDACIRNG
jgi:hypothetical protein